MHFLVVDEVVEGDEDEVEGGGGREQNEREEDENEGQEEGERKEKGHQSQSNLTQQPNNHVVLCSELVAGLQCCASDYFACSLFQLYSFSDICCGVFWLFGEKKKKGRGFLLFSPFFFPACFFFFFCGSFFEASKFCYLLFC